MTEKLPRKCECGGKMQYVHSLGLVFSACLSCTPVVVINVKKLQRAMDERTTAHGEN